MTKAESELNKICVYLTKLNLTATKLQKRLSDVNKIYQRLFKSFQNLVIVNCKTDWNDYTESEKRMTENTVLLVGLLYKMCQVKLVIQSNSKTEPNTVNTKAALQSIEDAKTFINDRGFALLL